MNLTAFFTQSAITNQLKQKTTNSSHEANSILKIKKSGACIVMSLESGFKTQACN